MTENILDGLRIFDGHNDSLMILAGTRRSFLTRGDIGHFDIPRAVEGRFGGGLFAIFVPPAGMEPEDGVFSTSMPARGGEESQAIPRYYAEWVTDRCIDRFLQLEEESDCRIRLTRSHRDLLRQFDDGTISAILHFEGAEAIAPDLGNLDHYYDRGLRSLGLVWSRPNAFGFGVDFIHPGSPDTGPGLTPAGFALVAACNARGILLDLSHLNEKGFWDVARTSTKPLVASHSCMHGLCPCSRNLTDSQLAAIKESNGVVGVNFAPAFLRADGQLTANTSIDEIVRHIRYGVDTMGIDHVAFGSDLDGVLLPDEVGSVAGLPKVLAALVEAGFDRPALAQIACGNWLRVLGDTLSV
jgi:membrane dipeptidase